MKIELETDKLRELAADLEKAAPRVGAAASAAIRKGSAELTRTAKSLAPKRLAPKRTGALAASIEASIYGDGRSSILTAVVGPTERYGLFQERGTSRHAAQPYMGPALEAVAPGVVAALEKAASEALK